MARLSLYQGGEVLRAMKKIHLFSLFVVIVASLFTLNSLAATRMKIHVLDNLSAKESQFMLKALAKLGYEASPSPLFTESTHALVITKVLGPALETESLSLEVLELKKNEPLPKTLFQVKSNEKSLEGLLKQAPSSDEVKNLSDARAAVTPVAALK